MATRKRTRSSGRSSKGGPVTPGHHHRLTVTYQAGRVVSITCSCGDVLNDLDFSGMSAEEVHTEHYVRVKTREMKVLADARGGHNAQ